MIFSILMIKLRKIVKKSLETEKKIFNLSIIIILVIIIIIPIILVFKIKIIYLKFNFKKYKKTKKQTSNCDQQ